MGKGIKIKAPKIKIGKDLGMKNLGKAASGIVKNAGSVGSQIVKTVGKGTEGIVGNTADIAGAIAKGDFKGIGKEALELAQSGKDIIKGATKAGLTAGTGTIEAGGNLTGSKDLTRAAANIQREGTKGVNTYGDAAIDVAANIGTGGTYGMAKQAASSLSSGGLGGLLSGKGLQEAALSAAGSYAGVDPNLMKMGMSAAKGDLKGAALQGLSSYGGLDPNMLKMGVSALTGDKGGIASGLASQFGAGDSAANMLGAAVGGKKNDMISALGGQLGLDPKMTSMLGSVVTGDLKGAALSQLAGATGLDPKLLNNLSSGKIDPMQLAGAAGVDPKKLLGGAADKLGISALTRTPAAEEIQKNVTGVTDKMSTAKNLTEKEMKALEATKQRELQDRQAELQADMKAQGVDFTKLPKGTQILGQTVDQDSARLQSQGDKALPPPTTPSEPWTLDRIMGNIKREAGQAVDKVKGAGSAVAGIAANNPNLTEGLIQGAGALGGYLATRDSTKEQQKILQRQEAEAKQINEMEKFQFDARRGQAYDQAYGFQQERIAQGGFTAAEAAQQKADDLRSAKMRQAARMAGLQSLAAKGQGSTGSGAAYAEMLSGMQEAADVGSQQDIARQKQASENLEKSYAQLPEMMEKKSQTEMNLSQYRSTEDVNRANQLQAVRASQVAAEAARGQALANTASAATNVVSNMVKGAIKDSTAADEQAKIDAEKAKLQQQQQSQQQTSNLNTKAAGAAKVAGTPPTPTTVRQPAEMATGQLGSGAGVLATPNADAMNQRYSSAPKPKSGVEQLLSGDLLKQGQQMMSKAPAPVQQTVNKAIDKGKDALSKFGIKI